MRKPNTETLSLKFSKVVLYSDAIYYIDVRTNFGKEHKKQKNVDEYSNLNIGQNIFPWV